jgi:predicted tellurium resistance membrane protein TerC
MLELLTSPEAWLAFATLTVLELVLGIDNVIFIAILVDKLKPEQREKARKTGLLVAMVMRVALLFVLAWIVGATKPLFKIIGNEISGRDLILLSGGLFLLWKSTKEMGQLLEGETGHESKAVRPTYGAVLLQIVIIDIVFSFDSIITAVGMAKDLPVMIAAVIAAVALMMWFAGSISKFVSNHPTVKMLALSFLFVIGVLLIADGFDHHVPKGYIYFAMAFSVVVEMLNIRVRKKTAPAAKPVDLHEAYAPPDEPTKP